jgi:hypothetical protein
MFFTANKDASVIFGIQMVMFLQNWTNGKIILHPELIKTLGDVIAHEFRSRRAS